MRIARARVVKPKLVIRDQAVSTLNVSMQEKIIKLLINLQEKFKLSIFFISGDFTVVRAASQRIMVSFFHSAL